MDAAVSAANAAYQGAWGKFTPAQRQTCMLRFAELVESNAERLATLECIPTGRPVTPTMKFDIAHMVQVYRCTSTDLPLYVFVVSYDSRYRLRGLGG